MVPGCRPKSVIFTGAQRIASELGKDALQTFHDAVTIATHPDSWRLGACILFDSYAFSAMYATEHDSGSLHAFSGGDAGAVA